MRVGIIAFLQESNTFLRQKTTLAQFQHDVLCEGEEVRHRLAGSHHEVGGFFTGLAEAGLTAVPIFAARALPYGTIEAEAFTELQHRLLKALTHAGPLDGLLVAPHGATVAENAPDADGAWLSAVREQVGPDMPIIGTLDLHANLSPAMVAACTALISYRSNPHLDQKQRGLDAARMMARTLRGEIHPVMTALYPPMVMNIERQATAEPHCRPLYALADAQLQRQGILSNSLLHGFPYADVAEMGVGVIAVADGRYDLAREAAVELADFWWQRRHDFLGALISVEEAVRRAAVLPGPVCLLDMGDNVGGGAPGDSTYLAHELHRQRVRRSFICLADPQAVATAVTAGVGATLQLAVGGKSDNLHGAPFEADFRVVGIYDGQFQESEPRHGGFQRFDQGRTAVVETESGLTIMLTTERMVPFSLNQLTSCGLNPRDFQVLVAKGVNAPVAAYAPVCPHLLRVDTPGATSANLDRLQYHHRRRPMFPFEPETVWNAWEAAAR
jgi:microcystin degradation protein MlrC